MRTGRQRADRPSGLQARLLDPRHVSGEGFIAEIRFADDEERIRVERTINSVGQWTLWGDPAIVLGYAMRVTPIRTAQPHEEFP